MARKKKAEKLTHFHIGAISIELDTKFTIARPPTQVVMDYGRDRLARLLREETGYWPDFPSYWSWDWIVEKGTYSGALPKRISKHYKETFGVTLSSRLLSTIGTMLKEYVQDTPDKVVFDLTNDLDWSAGQFGDDGSCLWTVHKSARKAITEAGGGAIRIYDPNEPDEGTGRAWIMPNVPREGMISLWNGYGEALSMGSHRTGNMSHFLAKFLASHLGLAFQRVELTNENQVSATLYINGGAGYLIGEQAQIERHKKYDLGIVTGDFKCPHCRQLTCVDSNWKEDSKKVRYCEPCWERRFVVCRSCANRVERTDTTEVDGKAICAQCLANETMPCEDCNNLILRADHHTRANRHVCQNCATNYNRCTRCDSWHNRAELTAVSHAFGRYCTPCATLVTQEYEAAKQRAQQRREEAAARLRERGITAPVETDHTFFPTTVTVGGNTYTITVSPSVLASNRWFRFGEPAPEHTENATNVTEEQE
jgi:hypothetical protein